MTAPNPRLSRLIKGFLSAKETHGRAPGTISEYRINLKRFCDFLEDPPIRDIGQDQIEDFINYLRSYTFSNPNSSKPATKKLSPKSLKNNWTTLSSFFSWVCSDLDLASPLTMPAPKARETPIIPLTEDEILAILNVCDYDMCYPGNREPYKAKRPTKWRDRAIVHILFDTGIRVSELCNMRMVDIDLANNRVYVTEKGMKSRYIFFSQETAQVLWKYHLQRFPIDEPEQDDFVFADRQHLSPLTRNAVRLLLARLGEKAGVSDVHPHRFRHSFAVAFLRNGGDAYALQDILGHESLSMTRKYVKLAQGDLKKIHRRASPISHMYKG